MKALLDPSKVDAHSTVVRALIKIGQPSVDEAIKLLEGKNEKLATYHAQQIQKATEAKEPPKDDPHETVAALVIGSAGRSSGLKPLIKALNEEGLKDDKKAVYARELAKIPATPESKTAFKRAFEELPLSAEIPPGANAATVLSESVGSFYDPGMVDWLLDQAENKKGSADEKKAFQLTAAITALKLAKKNQLPKVKAPLERYIKALPEDQRKPFEGMYDKVEKLVSECGEDASCYLKAIEKSENQDKDNQIVGIKAGYMLAIFGNEKTRDELIEALESVENAAVRFTAAQAIDQLSPKGSDEVAKKLEEIIEKNEKLADRDRTAADAPLRDVMYRVEARGG
jgi:HEAT repeat protein